MNKITIKTILKENGYTCKNLAEQLAITPYTLSRWLKDLTPYRTAKIKRAMAAMAITELGD